MPFLKVNSKSKIVNRTSIHHSPFTILKRKGFTLIELLVVIAIIGILATFIVASFTSAQQKGRDAKRKSDLDAIKKALELAKSDTTGSIAYPNGTSAMTEVYYVDTFCTPSSPNLVCRNYIKVLPADPKLLTCRTGYTGYCYTTSSATGCPAACSSYSLLACLENNNDPQGTAKSVTVGADGNLCAGNLVYTVTNP